jgi:prepilin peptidase CpaA
MQTSVLLFCTWASGVSFYDIRDRRVPNWLLGLGIVFGCVSIVLLRDAFMTGFSQSLLGAALAFVVFLPLYGFGAMGAADVKVFAVLGLWLGASALAPIWLWATVAAAIHAVCAIVLMRTHSVTVFGWTLAVGPRSGAGRIRGAPYAAFLTLAALCLIVNRHPSLIPTF